MRALDEVYTATPFYGSRRLQVALRRQGQSVNRKRVQRLMRLMGIEAVGPKPRLSQRHRGHQVYPYLLREVAIERVDQVWSCDIERHEALTNRAVMKGHRRVPVAAGMMKLGAA